MSTNHSSPMTACSGCQGITHTHTCGDPAVDPQLTSPVTEPALKPCPFCGCDAEEEHYQIAHDDCTLFGVSCKSCPARVRGFDQCQADANEAWNTRSIPAQRPIRQTVEDAIREHFKSIGTSAVVSSDGIERVYYSGFSLIKLAEAIASAVTSTVQQPVEKKVWPTGTGNTPQDVQLASLVTRADGGDTDAA